MKKVEILAAIYEQSVQKLKEILSSEQNKEKQLLFLIQDLSFENSFSLSINENYDINEVDKLFRYYEELLKDSFNQDKELFEIEFKLYLLIIKIFTELCNTFICDKEKRKQISTFFQTLKESKNMLKLFLPLDIKHINILNNLIGEQLYYFSHLDYHDITKYPLDYTFEKYLLNLERMFHGFDLSVASNFGNKEFTNEEIELAILKNNASFLILTLIYKIYSLEDNKIFKNEKFKNIINFYKNNFYLNECNNIYDIECLEKVLLSNFRKSSSYINKITKQNLLKDKLNLLALDTDEYKQLIDIIRKFDFQDRK